MGLTAQLRKGGNQVDREIIDRIVTNIFENFEDGGLPEPLSPVKITNPGGPSEARSPAGSGLDRFVAFFRTIRLIETGRRALQGP